MDACTCNRMEWRETEYVHVGFFLFSHIDASLPVTTKTNNLHILLVIMEQGTITRIQGV